MTDQLMQNSDTMDKVWGALTRAGLSEQQAIDAVSDMQNNGILFMERA